MALLKSDPEFRRLLDEIVDDLKRRIYKIPDGHVGQLILGEEAEEVDRETAQLWEMAQVIESMVQRRDERQGRQLGIAPWMCRDCD